MENLSLIGQLNKSWSLLMPLINHVKSVKEVNASEHIYDVDAGEEPIIKEDFATLLHKANVLNSFIYCDDYRFRPDIHCLYLLAKWQEENVVAQKEAIAKLTTLPAFTNKIEIYEGKHVVIQFRIPQHPYSKFVLGRYSEYLNKYKKILAGDPEEPHERIVRDYAQVAFYPHLNDRKRISVGLKVNENLIDKELISLPEWNHEFLTIRWIQRDENERRDHDPSAIPFTDESGKGNGAVKL